MRSGLVVLVAAFVAGGAREARAQGVFPGPVDPAQTPQPAGDPWPRLSDEEVAKATAPPPAAPPTAAPPSDEERPLEPRVEEAPAPRFGEAGEVVFSGDSALSIGSMTFARSDASIFDVSLSQGVDVFVLRGLSVGLGFGLSYRETALYQGNTLLRQETTSFAAGPRVGYDIRLGRLFSVYPRTTVGIESTRVERRDSANATSAFAPPTEATTASTGLYFAVFVPLLIHPAPHFFVGAGPTISHRLGGDERDDRNDIARTTFGARLVIGGWLGGPKAPVEEGQTQNDKGGALPSAETVAAPEEARPVVRPRFGDANQWVLSSEMTAGITSTTYGGGQSKITSAGVAPGVDYFVARGFSLGAFGVLSSTHSEGPTASPGYVSVDRRRYGGGIRFGGNQALGRWFSFNLRVSFAMEYEDYEASWAPLNSLAINAKNGEHIGTTVVTVGASAPILFHPASHVFIGFGPTVARDVVRDTPGRTEGNLATRLGAGLLVGGWL